MQESVHSQSLETAPRFGETSIARAAVSNIEAHADAYIALGVSALAALLFLKYDMLRQPFPPDTTFHVYAGQQMLLGHAIYRDVAIIKAPLSDFVAAFSMVLGRLFSIPDVIAPRIIFWLIAAATVGMTYLAGRYLFKERAIGLIAALMMLSYSFLDLRSVTGPEPKALVILFSLAALVLLWQRHWFWAGVCASLATLAWQPALMVAALACAVALVTRPSRLAVIGPVDVKSRQVTPPLIPSNPRAGFFNNPRWRQLLWVFVGGAIPLALLLIYLVANDALLAARNAIIGANYVHLYTSTARIPPLKLITDNAAQVVSDSAMFCFPVELPLVVVGVIGFVGIVAGEFIRAARARTWRSLINLERTPFILYALGFAAFTLIDYDFCPDLIPLMPVAAIGVGWLVWQMSVAARWLFERTGNVMRARQAQIVVLVIGPIVVAGVGLSHTLSYQLNGPTLSDQAQVAVAAEQYLQPTDRVLEFGDSLILIYTHRMNASKVLHLGDKSGLGVLAFEPGQMQGLIDSLDRNPPMLIALSRENKPDWTRPFYRWLGGRYHLVKTINLNVVVRMFVLNQP